MGEAAETKKEPMDIDEKIETMTVKELRAQIAAAGLSDAGCIEKADLRARARQAATMVTVGPGAVGFIYPT